MAEQQRPHEESAKDVVSADSKSATTPMERFKDLTRQLLGVSKEQLKAEQDIINKRKK
jgi:hypothetical protein